MGHFAPDHGPTSDDAVDHLRRHAIGVLCVDGAFREVRYVCGAGGLPTLFVPRGWLEAETFVLFVPADQPDALELLADPEPIDGQSADADRWRTYHGRSDDPLCVRLRIEAGKWRGQVFDGGELMRPNPCAEFEPAVCRWMNRHHRASLLAICRRFNRVEIDEALLVGLDRSGFDIRARAGIIRVEAPRPIADETQAREVLEEMCRRAEGVSE